MFNPLINNVQDLSDQELEEKIKELSKKYYSSMRFNNQNVTSQILATLTMFRDELQIRRRKEMQSQNGDNDNDNDLDDLINVN